MDKRGDLALMVFIIALGVWYFYDASQLTWSSRVVREMLGPAGLPKALAVLLVLGGLFLLVNRLRTWNREPGPIVEPEGEADEPGYPVSLSRVGLAMFLSLAYIVSLQPVGYLIATPTFLALFLLVTGLRSWRQIAMAALGLTVALYLAFGVLLQVRLPMGPIGG